jgi:hypothetical protein
MEKGLPYEEREICIGDVKRLLDEGYGIEVESPDGWVGVNYFIDKGMYEEFVLKMDSGSVVRCNGDHLFETTIGWVSARELAGKGQVHLLTNNGVRKGEVTYTGDMIPIVDINVDHENHRYFTNGISSHNTGVGKSLFMCHCAAGNLMQGLNVLYITMEMAEKRIAERIDANLLNVTVDELTMLPKEVYEKKIARVNDKTKGKLIIKEYPTACAGSGHFRHLLNELKIKRNFVPNIIYVDYLNICLSSRLKSGSNINSYTYVKAIAEELRGLAVEFDVPLISATQTTRSGYTNSDVGLEDVSESFGLPATADLMIALISTEELEQLNQIMVKQLKNRYNDPGLYKRFVIGVDRAKMKLYDVEQSAQEDILDDTPTFDKTQVGKEISGPKSLKNLFDDFR